MSEGAAAPRYEGRTQDIELPSPFEGWEFTARLDFPARWLEELGSGDVVRVCAAMDRWLVVEHNFPDVEGNLAASMADVFPVAGVLAALTAYQRASNTLPNP